MDANQIKASCDSAGDAKGADALEGKTFKQGMDALEAIVRSLESGELELEESLERYSAGVALLTALQRRLGEAQQQVEVLMGQLDAAPDDEIQDTTLLNA